MKLKEFKALTCGLDVVESKTLTYVHFTDPSHVEALVRVLRAENISYARRNLGGGKGHISLRTRDIDVVADLAALMLRRI